MVDEWKFARELVNIHWSPEVLIEKLEELPEDRKDLKFLFEVTYLSAARVSEVLNIIEGREVRPSLRFKDIWMERVEKGETEEEDKWNLCINVRLIKQDREKKAKDKWYKRRVVYIPIKKDRYDYPLVASVIETLYEIGWDKADPFYDLDSEKRSGSDKEFFNGVSTNWIQQLCNKHLKCNVHYLRHLRFGHLSKIDKLSPQELQTVGKWKSGDMALHYSQATQTEVQNKMWSATNG
jgi:hypothetical protein